MDSIQCTIFHCNEEIDKHVCVAVAYQSAQGSRQTCDTVEDSDECFFVNLITNVFYLTNVHLFELYIYHKGEVVPTKTPCCSAFYCRENRTLRPFAIEPTTVDDLFTLLVVLDGLLTGTSFASFASAVAGALSK